MPNTLLHNSKGILLVVTRALAERCAASVSPLSSALAADTTSKLDVLRHDRDALGVDCAQVGVLEQADEVRLAGLLEREHGQRLEAQVCGKRGCVLAP
jgi:hypothetical protein